MRRAHSFVPLVQWSAKTWDEPHPLPSRMIRLCCFSFLVLISCEYSYTSWCPAMHPSTVALPKHIMAFLSPNLHKRTYACLLYQGHNINRYSPHQAIRPQKSTGCLWSSPWVCFLWIYPSRLWLIICRSRYLTAATIFRGNVSSREAEVNLSFFHRLENKSDNAPGCGSWSPNAELAALCWVSTHPWFRIIIVMVGWSICRWIPDNVSVSLVSTPPVGQKLVRDPDSVTNLYAPHLAHLSLIFRRPRHYLTQRQSRNYSIEHWDRYGLTSDHSCS